MASDVSHSFQSNTYHRAEEDEIDEVVTHHAYPEHRLRITQPKLCDTSVKQYSGYLDISETRHLFFWCVAGTHS